MNTPNNEQLLLTVKVVASYVANNSVPAADMPALIHQVHTAFSGLGAPSPAKGAEKQQPPVAIRKSITPHYLISLEDGKQYKALRRHLAVRGLTPEQYRAKWDLPIDYPMVASTYAAKRSELARKTGLGRRPKAHAGKARKDRKAEEA
jgi:predicted transcriptional regulator